MHENGKLSNVIMWAFRFGAVYIHPHIKQSHQSQFKKKSFFLKHPVDVSYLMTPVTLQPKNHWDVSVYAKLEHNRRGHGKHA